MTVEDNGNDCGDSDLHVSGRAVMRACSPALPQGSRVSLLYSCAGYDTWGMHFLSFFHTSTFYSFFCLGAGNGGVR